MDIIIGLIIIGVLGWIGSYVLDFILDDLGPKLPAIFNFFFQVLKMIITLVEGILKILGTVFKGILYGFDSLVKTGTGAMKDVDEIASRRKTLAMKEQRDEEGITKAVYNAYQKIKTNKIEAYMEIDRLKQKYGEDKIKNILLYIYRLEQENE